MTMTYRRDIDGLRALAVLAVIIFHGFPALLTGGFVGVDVFFVISGYLITAVLVSEMEAGDFSLAGFYERRARRILPALFLVLGASVIAAWLWLMPDDMESFAGSLSAVSLFASNLFFWRTSGYFEAATDLKPLLHTWSLAVEEQYYLVFPLFLLLLRKYRPAWVVATVVILAAASLWAAQHYVAGRPGAVFYLLPTRGWELGLGALLALRHVKHEPVGSEALALLGLALIAASVLAYHDGIPFPSLYALVPTVGAVLVIHAANGTAVGRALGSKPLVGVGLISYSAYLWHQPLFAFAKHRNFGDPTAPVLLGLVGLTLVLAYLSWRWVELPFRNRKRFTRAQVFSGSVAGSVAFLAVGLAGQATNGFEGRLSADRRAFLDTFEVSLPEWRYVMSEGLMTKFRAQCDFYDLDSYRAGFPTDVPRPAIAPECYQRNGAKHSVLVWGDSHAQNLVYGLIRTLPKDWQVLQVTSSSCTARLNARFSRDRYCENSNAFAYQTILKVRPDVVIIGQARGHDGKAMERMAKALRGVGVGRVLFTGPTPHWRADLPKLMAFKLWENTPRRTFVGVDRDLLSFRAPGVDYISLTDYFCNAEGCLVYFGNDRRRGITSWDRAHITPLASYHLARDVLSDRVSR